MTVYALVELSDQDEPIRSAEGPVLGVRILRGGAVDVPGIAILTVKEYRQGSEIRLRLKLLDQSVRLEVVDWQDTLAGIDLPLAPF